MNKRLHTYCSIMLLLIGLMIAYGVFVMIRSVHSVNNFTTQVEEARATMMRTHSAADSVRYKQLVEMKNMKVSDGLAIEIRTIDFNAIYPVTVQNQLTGKSTNLYAGSFKVPYELPIWATILHFLCMGIGAYAFLYILFIYLKLLRNFRKEENIFSLDNLNLLRKLAIFTAVGFLALVTGSGIEVYFAQQTLVISGLKVEYLSTLGIDSGPLEILSALIVYEVFAIGVRMRQENDLVV